MSVKLLTEHHLELLSLKGGCTGSSESSLFKIPYCWKSHVAAHIHLLDLKYLTSYQFPHIPGGWIIYGAPNSIMFVNYDIFVSLAHTYNTNKTTTLNKMLATLGSYIQAFMMPRGCLQFVIVVFPDHTHLLFNLN